MPACDNTLHTARHRVESEISAQSHRRRRRRKKFVFWTPTYRSGRATLAPGGSITSSKPELISSHAPALSSVETKHYFCFVFLDSLRIVHFFFIATSNSQNQMQHKNTRSSRKAKHRIAKTPSCPTQRRRKHTTRTHQEER